jgi:hypothetical protein
MVILSTDLEEETIRSSVERWLQLIESKGAERLADEVIRHKVLRVPEAAYGPPKGAGASAEA